MPTGTKIAVIVLVVLLGAAGLYYAFVPPAPAPKSDSLRPSTSMPSSTAVPGGTLGSVPNSIGTLGGGTLGGSTGAPSTLPPAGVGSTAGSNTSSTGTPTTDGLEALAARQRQLTGAGGSATTGSTTGSPTGNTTALNNGGDSTSGLTGGTTGSTVPSGAPANGVASRNFNNGFNNGFRSGSTGASTDSPSGTSGANSTKSASSTTSTPNSTPNSTSPSNSGSSGSGTGESTHVVKKGETMESIAKSYYGAGSKWQVIAKANPSVNPDTMRIGTKLRIPAAGASATNESTVASRSSSSGGTTTTTASKATSSGSGGTHVVAKGETLSSIARRYYGDSKYWKSILKANPKVKAETLAVGTKLSIPAKTTVVGGENVER